MAYVYGDRPFQSTGSPVSHVGRTYFEMIVSANTQLSICYFRNLACIMYTY